jgi:uncharacterized protein (TIGR00290 family)
MRTILSWSSGKDSAWALHRLRQMPDIEPIGLVTTINEAFDRVAMHGVRRALVEAQARAAGLPLHIVPIPSPCPNEVYAERMSQLIADLRRLGAQAMAFGDLFLADIRAYRERQLSGTGLEPLFPLWGLDTRMLAADMLAGGLEATIICVDPQRMDRSFAGRRYDADLVATLPPEADPCGENGEFHTFASAGPMFVRPIPVSAGDVVERDGFVFADLLPGGQEPP